MDIFIRIKRLVVARRVVFTEKAETEMVADALTPELVYESILNAPTIFKVLRSRNPHTKRAEKLYIIKGMTFDGLDIYTKGKIVTKEGVDVFYVLISSKRSTDFRAVSVRGMWQDRGGFRRRKLPSCRRADDQKASALQMPVLRR